MANTYLQRTVGTPTNSQKYTYSFWIKRCELSDGSKEAFLLDAYADGSNRAKIAFQSGDQLEIWNSHSGSDTFALNPPRKFRDTNAWYHIVLSVDTTQSTASDRVKLYVNGVQETSLGSTTYPSQNDANNTINESGTTFSIMAYGGNASSNSYRLSSIMSHVYFVDGTAYPASTFGSTDTNGEWKINTSPSITMGNNGFTILKDGNTITDQSSNSNNFTLGGGTLTNMVDNPSDNFATVNISYYSAENVNATGIHFCNTGVNQSGTAAPFYSTIAVPSGKYYWEGFVETVGTNNMHGVHRTQDINQATNAGNPANGTYGYAYRSDGSKFNGGAATSYGNSFTTGDYVSVAYDATNGAIWFAKNGTWQNSATTSEIAAGTTTNAAFSSMPTNGVFYTPYTYLDNSGVVRFNFGNGVFGATALTGTTYSPTVGSTSAKFKYNIVPSGFAALSTKGLNA
tara:strand:+ start:28 stop:1395 length:1368 start_codon:yes stop_codon:yes gene_type:complete